MAVSIGIDLGSVATKCVAVEDSKIIAYSIMDTGSDSEKSAEFVFNEVLQKLGKKESRNIISTGYGRRIFKNATKVITEISAAGSGIYKIAGEKECLAIDVGGQDTKVIEVGENGKVVDFLMNDKCAAGTGRFLEMMARALETDLEGLSEIAMQSRNPVTINSTCSVFAESEVISLIAQKSKKEDIAGGLFNAISTRIANMTKNFPSNKPIFFCGGGAKSPALKDALIKIIGREIIVPENPQFIVAYGAALS